MSFVIVAPETVTTAAQDLAGIRSLLAESSAAAAAPTTGVVAAAADEVSAGVASLFGAFGQEYQDLSAQAGVFHDQFVNLLNAGAGAYLSTDVANAEQALTNAVNAPAQALLGQSSIGTGTALAASQSAGSAATAATSAVSGAVTSAAFGGNILAPYDSLVTNTLADLQGIGNTWSTVTAPALLNAVAGPIVTSLQTGNLGPLLTVPGHIVTGYANLVQALAVPVSISATSINPPNATIALGLGLPQLLAFDALGAPVNAAIAATASETAIATAVQTGNPLVAASAFIDAPANIANAFLNGEQTLSVRLPLPGLSLTADVPFAGLLAPLQPLTVTAMLPGNPEIQTVTVTGPPVGGVVPALLEYVPELLVSDFGF